jgi:hypothetical protein
MLVIEDLDEASVERAGALVAREHAAARQVRPELPAGFGGAGFCTAALQRLRDSGHHGLVATGDGRTVAVMTATVRQHPAGRSPGPTTTATSRSRSTSTPPTRCLDRSGSTTASTRPDTVSSGSSTAAPRASQESTRMCQRPDSAFCYRRFEVIPNQE